MKVVLFVLAVIAYAVLIHFVAKFIQVGKG
jgi:hypothetical protein